MREGKGGRGRVYKGDKSRQYGEYRARARYTRCEGSVITRMSSYAQSGRACTHKSQNSQVRLTRATNAEWVDATESIDAFPRLVCWLEMSEGTPEPPKSELPQALTDPSASTAAKALSVEATDTTGPAKPPEAPELEMSEGTPEPPLFEFPQALTDPSASTAAKAP